MSFPQLQTSESRMIVVFLLAVPGIGRATVNKIAVSLQKFHLTWQKFISADTGTWALCGLKKNQVSELQRLREKITPREYQQKLHQNDVTVLFPDDRFFPLLLKEIPDPPLCLFVRGEVERLCPTGPVVGVVGTRKMSEYGRYAAQTITQELCHLETTIVSGLMYGVDLAAHESAIENGGNTIGVLGYGFESLDSMEYLSSSWLEKFMSTTGVLCSEYAPEKTATKGSFLQRNRLIAGMSHAVVVVEAALRSGSLRTAACAVEYNRLVCAVPGSIRSQFSEGTRELVNKGAVLISSGYQVIKELEGTLGISALNQQELPSPKQQKVFGLTDLRQQIYQYISEDQVTIDQITQHVGVPLSEVYEELTQLELRGYIKKIGTRWDLASSGFAN